MHGDFIFTAWVVITVSVTFLLLSLVGFAFLLKWLIWG